MKSRESNKRRSGYNPDRNCYLTSDGKYYCYKFWDETSKCMVTQRLKVGQDLSVELAAILDENDHEMDLNNRYERELLDPVFNAMLKSREPATGFEDTIDPWSTIADKNGNPEEMLFSNQESKNPQALVIRRVIDQD